jgi:hypothetical protein
VRLTASLVLPSEIERARRDGTLVVFAGSGISVDAPAGLPDFPGLARGIGEPMFPLKGEDEKSLDRYLGRLSKGGGVNVDQLARRILGVRPGEFNDLHRWILGLFPSAAEVRLVTTNFDSHFQTAAKVVHPDHKIPQFVGPAIPPGIGFRGIVRLHGALEIEDYPLVLTDKEFASAYMTDGWAARFLVGLFAERTVLFVGYGLNDPVVRYLLSALPPTKRWFALCHEDEKARWEENDVRPVSFPSGADGDRFSEFRSGLQRWYWYSRASALDHTVALEQVLREGPPKSPLDADYLRARLETPSGRALFWGEAKTPDWFEWALEEGLLAQQFQDGVLDEIGGGWCVWIVRNFASAERPILLKAVRRSGLRLNPLLGLELALWLWKSDEFPAHSVVNQYVALIVGQFSEAGGRQAPYPYLLERLAKEGAVEAGIALYRWLAQPRLKPSSALSLALSETEERQERAVPPLATEIHLRGDPGDLADALRQGGPSLAQRAPLGFLDAGISRLAESYELVGLAAADSTADWFSFAVRRIDKRGDGYSKALDALVESVRVSIDAAADADEEFVARFVGRYGNDSRALFRRFAVYALTLPSASVDLVVSSVCLSSWVGDLWVRPELFLLFKTRGPSLHDQQVERLLQFLTASVDMGAESRAGQAALAIGRLLGRHRPQDKRIRLFLQEYGEAAKDEAVSDDDGLLLRTEISWGPTEPSPISEEQLLAEAPSVAWEKLRSVARAGVRSPSAWALAGMLLDFAKRDPVPAIELLAAVGLREPAFDDGAISALLNGLRDGATAPAHRLRILDLLLPWEWSPELRGSIGGMIDHWSGSLGDAEPESLLLRLEQVADRLFAQSTRDESNLIAEGRWFERSINHPAGRAAEVWWAIANARDRRDHERAIVITDAEKARWRMVLDDQTNAGAFARPILGMASERLGNGDAPWSAEHLYPAFDPSQDEVIAAQLWDGRLAQLRWSWTVVSGLGVGLRRILQEWPRLLPKAGERIADMMALLAVFANESGVSLDDLLLFAKWADEGALVSFIDAIEAKSARIDPPTATKLFRELLRPYLDDRMLGRSTRPVPAEGAALVGWVFVFHECPNEVLDLLEKLPIAPATRADSFLLTWEDDPAWLNAHPTEAVRLIEILARNKAISRWFGGQAVKALGVALDRGTAPKLVADAGLLLVEQAVAGAAEVVKRAQRLA